MTKTQRKITHIIAVLTEKGFKETTPSVFEKDGVIISFEITGYIKIKIIDESNDWAFQALPEISEIDIL